MIAINNKKYYTAEEVANILGVSRRSVMLLVKNRRIEAYKPSERKTFFEIKNIINYIER